MPVLEWMDVMDQFPFYGRCQEKNAVYKAGGMNRDIEKSCIVCQAQNFGAHRRACHNRNLRHLPKNDNGKEIDPLIWAGKIEYFAEILGSIWARNALNRRNLRLKLRS